MASKRASRPSGRPWRLVEKRDRKNALVTIETWRKARSSVRILGPAAFDLLAIASAADRFLGGQVAGLLRGFAVGWVDAMDDVPDVGCPPEVAAHLIGAGQGPAHAQVGLMLAQGMLENPN